MPTLHEVFGVSKDPVQSYFERPHVDSTFQDVLKGSQHIVIYGSSKQGKSALLHRHVVEADRVTVHCGPNSKRIDIYRALLRQLDVEVVSTIETEARVNTKLAAKAGFKAFIPFYGGGKAEAGVEAGAEGGRKKLRKKFEFNIEVAQDVGELLGKLELDEKFFVLENFHYLETETQAQIAFDLRTFEEMGFRFIILGIWREANRLAQFNGDLQDRIKEIPVEPWTHEDYAHVVRLGSEALNIEIAKELQDEIFYRSHGSIAVVQELSKALCKEAGIESTQLGEPLSIEDRAQLDAAIALKVSDYQARHVRALDSIAAGSRTKRETENTRALYLPYYLVKVLIESDFETIAQGIERKQLQEMIQAVHPIPKHVRTSDVTSLLKGLGRMQARKSIIPPILDYDPSNRRLRIIDLSLFFFVESSDPAEILSEIPHPDPDQAG